MREAATPSGEDCELTKMLFVSHGLSQLPKSWLQFIHPLFRTNQRNSVWGLTVVPSQRYKLVFVNYSVPYMFIYSLLISPRVHFLLHLNHHHSLLFTIPDASNQKCNNSIHQQRYCLFNPFWSIRIVSLQLNPHNALKIAMRSPRYPGLLQ